jgi:hypothetical protein
MLMLKKLRKVDELCIWNASLGKKEKVNFILTCSSGIGSLSAMCRVGCIKGTTVQCGFSHAISGLP